MATDSGPAATEQEQPSRWDTYYLAVDIVNEIRTVRQLVLSITPSSGVLQVPISPYLQLQFDGCLRRLGEASYKLDGRSHARSRPSSRS